MKAFEKANTMALSTRILALCGAMLLFALLLTCSAMADNEAVIYSADFSSDTDGWYSFSTGTAYVKTLRDNALRTDARQSDDESPRRDFDLVPSSTYAFSVEIRHFRSSYADFTVNTTHNVNGREVCAEIARLSIPGYGWTTLDGTFAVGSDGQITLSVQTTDAPDLTFDIRSFRLTLLKESCDYRPEIHFTPSCGWINDPNGLVWDDGVWHMFAQHYPYDTAWGPMHWLHATSTDLIHWEEQGIALYPDDEHGMAFSGSAVIDADGTAGYGKNAMILFYTGHGEWEQQMLAGSRDRVNFELYEANPVIANTDKPDFRDPKVIRNDVLNSWTMIVAAGDHDEFYASTDLLHWRKTGEFSTATDTFGAVYECPDLFPLSTPNGDTVWVLVNSLTLPYEMGGNKTVYFLGEFDGNTFHETMPSDELKYIDTGFDNYAAVTFANTNRTIMVGWGNSWCYAYDEPVYDFRGNMTCARELSLIDTDAGLKLSARPIMPQFDLAQMPMQSQAAGDVIAKGALTGELFHIRVVAEPGFSLTLSNDIGEALVISVDGDNMFTVDRSHAGQTDFSELYASDLFSVMRVKRALSDTVALDLYFDHMIAEIFTDDGAIVNTSLVFPTQPYRTATLRGNGQLWIGNSIKAA